MPYRWLSALPPFDSMRHPFTFASVALFLLAVLAGLGWARLGLAVEAMGRPGHRPARDRGDADRRAAPARDPARACRPRTRSWRRCPPGPILELPVFAAESVLWAARHGRPVLNGIGAFGPAQTLVLDRYIQNHWLAGAPEDIDTSRPTPYLLGRFPVRYVIVPVGTGRTACGPSPRPSTARGSSGWPRRPPTATGSTRSSRPPLSAQRRGRARPRSRPGTRRAG